VLPVLALMVVAVWLLGVGTLKDLALVQLVGILVGTYSSLFLATPLLVTLRERTELVRTHTRRVVRRRKPGAEAVEPSKPASEEPADETTEVTAETAAESSAAPASDKPAPNKPAPGARPVRPTGTRRPTGKRNAGRR
jgi:preprotein translocase subunit SecF